MVKSDSPPVGTMVHTARYLLVILAVAVTSSCLAPPEPEGPANGTTVDTGTEDTATPDVDTPDLGNTNNALDMTASSDVHLPFVCDGCTVDARQCGTAGGYAVLQVCRDTEGGGADCTRWLTEETCVGDQECSPSAGCICTGPDVCNPGSEPECVGDGVSVCVLVNGCGRRFDVGRTADCAPLDTANFPECGENSTAPWCVGCEDGRECSQACDNNRGYVCGEVVNP